MDRIHRLLMTMTWCLSVRKTRRDLNLPVLQNSSTSSRFLSWTLFLLRTPNRPSTKQSKTELCSSSNSLLLIEIVQHAALFLQLLRFSFSSHEETTCYSQRNERMIRGR
ncbi:uncharacterized protein [Blastocystis hominis]|uniref:Uncharacterized protein n=1 Tax=Blastocystis hominis TaxID=12968 RepID=D8LWR2_BLAHO|nr:uncharacterized protein [Blastocystis hominis]CBK20251.2 unnamed protein product [Blastocystis hominis]|eukprot:XP_012894299.1 uncharacterized protein [Blastocystis hominis]